MTTAIIEITRKPTPRQVEALRYALTSSEGIVEVSADKRTHEGLVGRGLADWKRPETLGRSVHGTAVCVITKAGRDYLAALDRPQTGPADIRDVTAEEIEQGVESALQWLPYGVRDERRAKGATAVLAAEFQRSRKLWRSLMAEGGRVQVENQALVYYGKVQKLLAASRLADQRAQEAASAPRDVLLADAAAHFTLREEQARTASPWAVAGVRISTPMGRGTVTGRSADQTMIDFAADEGGAARSIIATSPYLARLCTNCDTVGDDSMPARDTDTGHLCGYCAAQTAITEDTMTETPAPAFRHDPTAPTPGVDADGRPYAVGDTVESTHRARTGARRGMAADEGTVVALQEGRPVVQFTTGDGDMTDVRPDLFRITTPAAPAEEPGQSVEVPAYTVQVTRRVVSYTSEECRYADVAGDDHEHDGECYSLDGDSRELESPSTEDVIADADDLELFDGDAVAWAVEYVLTKTDAVEPSSSPVGDAARAHEWLSGSYADPYQERTTETSVYLTEGWTDEQRAQVFKGVAAKLRGH